MLQEIVLNEQVNIDSTGVSYCQKSQSEIDRIIECTRELESIGDKLFTLTHSTEKDFLQIGYEIGDFSIRSHELAELTTQATGLISGEDMRNIIIELDEMLTRIQRYLLFNAEELDDKIKILKRIQASVNKNSKPLKDLTRLVMELRFLGMSIRIESARLNEGNNSFISLSNDVNNLADMVSEKLENIQAGITGSGKLLSVTVQKIINFKLQQGTYARTIIDQIIDCLKSLQKKHAFSIQSINGITVENIEITTGVGEIVSSLQFHDIVRQKIEHVKEAFEALVSQVNSWRENKDIEIETAKLTCKMTDVCELQLNHLSNTRLEIVHAVENLIENETRIAVISRNMVKKTCELMQSSGENKACFFDEIPKNIASIKDSLYENARINFELTNSISRISAMSEEMVVFITDIKLIGKKITLLALNAIINAEHLNKEGVALSILAEGMQRLADTAKDEILQIASNMNEISIQAGELMGGKTAIEQKDTIENVVNGMMNDLNNLISHLNNTFENVNQKLTVIEEKGKIFFSDMEQSIKRINVHKLFDKVLQESIFSLKKIINATNKLTPDYKGENKRANLSSMNNNYTMKSERNIHVSFLMDKKAASRANYVVERPVAGNSSDLGDNVELF